MKKKYKRKSHIFQILTALILSFVCAFGCIGCVGFIGDYSYVGDNEEGKDPFDPNDPMGGGGDYEDNDNYYEGGSFTSAEEVFLGAVVEYDTNEDSLYYDEYQDKLVSFEYLADRQFSTMAQYLHDTLRRFYGSNSGQYSDVNYVGYYNVTLKDFQNKEEFAQIPYSETIKSNLHWKIIAGEETRLNFVNTIANGGYQYNLAVNNSDYSVSKGYDTSSVMGEGYAWKGRNYLNVEFLDKALRYIYNYPSRAQQGGNNHLPDSYPEIVLEFGIDENRQEYFTNLNLETVSNMSRIVPDSLGVNREFLWDVGYFIAYSLIGGDNIQNSINYRSDIIKQGSVVELLYADLDTQDKLSHYADAFAKYKGYEKVIPELVTGLFDLCYSTGYGSDPYFFRWGNDWVWGSPANEIGDVFTSDNIWRYTAFPNLKNSQYVFYEDISEIAWGCGGWEKTISNEDGQEEDIYYLEKPKFTECDTCSDNEEVPCFNCGMTIKSVYLIPRVTEKYAENTTTEYTEYFYFGGLLFGLSVYFERDENGNLINYDYNIQNENRYHYVYVNTKYINMNNFDQTGNQGNRPDSLADAVAHEVQLYGYLGTAELKDTRMKFYEEWSFNYGLIDSRYDSVYYSTAVPSVIDYNIRGTAGNYECYWSDVDIEQLIEESFGYRADKTLNNSGEWRLGHTLTYEFSGNPNKPYDEEDDGIDKKTISFLSAQHRLFANKGEISIKTNVLKYEFAYKEFGTNGPTEGADGPENTSHIPSNTMMFFQVY